MKILTRSVHSTMQAFFGKPDTSLLRKLFVAAMIIFLTAKVALTVIPLSQRQIPIEPDDAYAYIQRAAQIEFCLFDDCPALDNILEQVQIPTAQSDIGARRGHLYHRTFPFIYPLHSVLIFSAHKLGLSWETSYAIVSIFGVFVLGISIALLLKTLFNYAGAAIALLLLGPYIFQSGLLYSGVPQSWAMGVALFAWGITLSEYTRWDRFLPILFLLPILFHPVGALLTLVSAALVVIGPRKPAFKWRLLILGLVFSSVALLSQTLTTNPTLASGVQLGSTRSSLLSIQNLAANLEIAKDVVVRWAYTYWNGWVVFPIILASFALLERAEKQKFVPLFGLLFLLLVGSVLGSAFLRGFPPNLFARLWVLLAILLVGLLGRAIWFWYLIAASHKSLPAFTKTGTKVMLLALMGVLIGLALITNAQYIQRTYAATIQSRIDRGNQSIDPAFAEFLSGQDAPAHIIYGNEIIFHYALLHGAAHHRASFYPILVGTDQAESWLMPLADVVVIMDASPMADNLLPFLEGQIDILTDGGDFVLARVLAGPEPSP